MIGLLVSVNPAFARTAFKVASLGDLQTFYRQVKEQGLLIKLTLHHGGSSAFQGKNRAIFANNTSISKGLARKSSVPACRAVSSALG